MYDYLYAPPTRSDEHYHLVRWIPLPDGKGRDRQNKFGVLEVAEGIKLFFEKHLQRPVNVSMLPITDVYILVSVGHFAYVIAQVLKNLSDLECPHINIDVEDVFRITITLNYELPVPKNALDIAIAAEHSGFQMMMDEDRLIFEAKLRRPAIMTLYQPRPQGFAAELERAILSALKNK